MSSVISPPLARRSRGVALGLLACAALATCRAVARPDVSSHRVIRDAALDSAAYDRAVRTVAAASPAAPFRADSARIDAILLRYRLLAPATVQPGVRYPLVLSLHGSGAMGTDNFAQLGAFARAWAVPALRARFPAYVLVPQFAERSAVYENDARDGLPRAEATPALAAALALVERLRDSLPIDRDRVYAVGFSMGGSAAWLALASRPDLIAAAVPIAGVPPARAVAPMLVRAPVLVLHGDADTENPFAAARAMVRALEAAGGHPRMWTYAGVAHEVPAPVIAGTDWREWLFAQRRGRE